ncbi:MAG: carbohydrate transporter rane protein 1, family [Bacilli bacterium]|nr:carbohydrate transporter rane protein 1, family [Bacilli bacterium]
MESIVKNQTVPLTQKKRFSNKRKLKANLVGWLMASPWIIGFLVFTLGPTLGSLEISFTDWNLLSAPNYVGMSNYIKMANDPLIKHSVWVTTYYSVVTVPLHLIIGFLLALFLNRQIKGMTLWRTIYYLPTIISGVAVSLLWKWLFNPDFGVLNDLTGLVFHIGKFDWLGNETLVIPSLILMSLWSVGGSMLIYLAGLQNIPTELYESAQLDGAGGFKQLLYITLPMMTPVLFLNLIMGIISSFQTFTSAFVMTGGGPNHASLFYMLELYFNAFQDFHMGYASAMAWVLFVYILILTLLVFVSGKYWVYYEGGERPA